MRKKIVRTVWLFSQLFVSGCILLPLFLMFTKVSWKDFYQILIEEFWFYPKFWNSLLLAATISGGAVIVSLLAAMGLRMGNIRRKGIILFFLLLLLLMPQQTTLLPNYIGLRDLKLLDTRSALILPMLFSPFAIYLMYQYMETISYEGWEAARLETDSVFCILWSVVLPQMRACLAAVFVFMFAEGFNMVEQPLYFVRKEQLKPLSVLADSLPEGKGHFIYAVGILCMVPMLLLYGFFEEELAEGLGYLKL